MGELKFTKLDSARRQLEMAIQLYFSESDPVSIHTLAGAANELLRGLTKHLGEEPMIKDQTLASIKPEFKKEVATKLHEAQNFFKHADRDPDKVLSLNPGQTEILILDSCWAYRRLGAERLPVLATFELWSAITWAKSFLTFPGLADAINRSERDIAGMSKREFFDEFVAIGYSTLARPDA